MAGGVAFGVPIGLAMGLSSRARGFFDTAVKLLRPIPPLALLPLFIIWFGIGDSSASKLLVFASIWIMIIAARVGVRTVALSKVRAAYSLGSSKWQILRRVILPNALPECFTGVRVALEVSWGTRVAAELVGIRTGLGAVIIISVIGVLMDIGMRSLEACLIPWRGAARSVHEQESMPGPCARASIRPAEIVRSWGSGTGLRVRQSASCFGCTGQIHRTEACSPNRSLARTSPGLQTPSAAGS